jgi:hypothetical protein
MPKYAPANEAGEKPYIVETMNWGKDDHRLVYAETPSDARWKAVGRGHTGLYVRRTRRATVEDMQARLGKETP